MRRLWIADSDSPFVQEIRWALADGFDEVETVDGQTLERALAAAGPFDEAFHGEAAGCRLLVLTRGAGTTLYLVCRDPALVAAAVRHVRQR